MKNLKLGFNIVTTDQKPLSVQVDVAVDYERDNGQVVPLNFEISNIVLNDSNGLGGKYADLESLPEHFDHAFLEGIENHVFKHVGNYLQTSTR